MASILLAASQEPRSSLQRVLAGHEIVCADSISQADMFLRERAFDLIVCTILFDDSRMFDLLRLAKSRHELQQIPFICARIMPHVLDSRIALEGVAFTCRALGAAAFLNIAEYKLDPDRELRQAIERCLDSTP
jgi:DNA-binding NtrC family response regulator